MGLREIQEIKSRAKEQKPVKRYTILKVSKKRQKLLDEQKEQRKGGGSELDRWFAERRKEMTGLCSHCGDPSCKNNDQYFKFSIAHILPKNLFISVKTHPKNWIELCFWNKSHHTNFDNKTLDIMELNCFDEVIEKFVAMYPDIDPKERKYIPDVLLQYLNM